MPLSLSRRRFLGAAAAGAAWPRLARAGAGPSALAVASGDVTRDRAVVWARADRPGRLVVEWSADPRGADTRTVRGTVATPATGLTAKAELTGLPPGRRVLYHARFEDAGTPSGGWAVGGFVTAPADRRTVRFGFSGDQVGQGFGIDPTRGGMRIFETLDARGLDFFVHCGDRVYADGPLPAEKPLADGTIWRNRLTDAKRKVAETLDEFRGQYAYNHLDAHYRRFLAGTSMVVTWDDHETRNNWYPGRRLDDDERYREKRCDVLAARARQACLEWAPIAGGRFDRQLSFGPHLDLFVLDARSYRGRNTGNDQPTPGARTPMLGRRQLDALKAGLRASTATWKVLVSDMPFGLVIPDGDDLEGFANFAPGAGPTEPRGREHELAELFGFVSKAGVRNLICITADVHYAAAHHYLPERARTPHATALWELVAGPLHAGGFGPNPLDPTFGPELVYCQVAPDAPQNRPPTDESQTFGEIEIDGRTGALQAALLDRRGRPLWSKTLMPA